jgi:ribosomal protein S18 acetylase RimI-like enzyme
MPKVGAVLADAFQHDPVWNKLFEGESDFEEKFRAFFMTPIKYCMKFGEAYAVSENLEAIAAWVPGDRADMTMWRLIRSGALRYGMKMGARIAKKMKLEFRSLLDDRKEHMGERPFIYLFMMGVASKYQGQGFGGILLRALIEKSEKSGIPLYLDTETEVNVRFYERFGFKTLKQITLPLFDLPMWEMLREPETSMIGQRRQDT